MFENCFFICRAFQLQVDARPLVHFYISSLKQVMTSFPAHSSSRCIPVITTFLTAGLDQVSFDSEMAFQKEEILVCNLFLYFPNTLNVGFLTQNAENNKHKGVNSKPKAAAGRKKEEKTD